MSEVEKIRSAEKEADLDRKIQEIRLRNEQLEERHKIVTEEAKQNGVPKSFQKATVNNSGGQHKSGSNHTNLKTSETIPSTKKGNGIGELKGNQWSREWDRGKTSAEDWKMNVPEVGDHGNSYFKTDSSNGTSSIRGGNRRDSGGRGGAIQHQHQQRGRRPAQGGSKPQPPHNPGFFHDDRFDEAKMDENGTNDSAPQKTNDGKQQTEGHKKFPPRNNNPRKPATMNKSFENDKNQNDSNKPNMNVSNGFGQRQNRRGGGGNGTGTQQPSRNNLNQHPRRGAPTIGTTGGAGVRHPPQQQNGVNGINGNQNGSKDFEIQRKQAPKIDGNKTQNVKDPNSDKQRSVPSNRGRYFKSFGKPANYSNPRQNKVPSQKPKPTNNNNGISKPQNPKLDKDGQAVKRLIDNIIDQVVRHERKEQKKNGEGEEESDVTQGNQSNGISESENQGNENSNEEKLEEKEKSENVEKNEKKDEPLNENEKAQNENKVESNNVETPNSEGNNNESKAAETDSAKSKTDESHAENVQEQKTEEQPKTNASETHSENQPQP